MFADEATRGQVDEFLRSKVQPYTTQLEQQASQAKDATQLWNQLNENPVETYVRLTTEMFGEAAGQAVLAEVQQQVDKQQQPPQQDPNQQQMPTDPRFENVANWVEQQQNQAYYEQEMARIQQAHPEVRPELFHPFVAAADGNFNEAVNIYNNYITQWNAANAAPVPPVPEAPAVIGSDAATVSTPPVEPKKQSLDEAIGDFMNEQRLAKEAPPVSG